MSIRCARLPRLAFIVIGLAVLSSGCGGETSPKPVFPVSGKVLVDGKPAAHATVILHPVGESGPDVVRPRAQVGPDGTFTVSTYGSGDGAPAGEYAVTVEWWLTNAAAGKGRGDDLPPANRLPARYASAASSGLKATVGEGATELEAFRLSRR